MEVSKKYEGKILVVRETASGTPSKALMSRDAFNASICADWVSAAAKRSQIQALNPGKRFVAMRYEDWVAHVNGRAN